jgi:hypothetical protein
MAIGAQIYVLYNRYRLYLLENDMPPRKPGDYKVFGKPSSGLKKGAKKGSKK